MPDALERITNLVALLLNSREAFTLERIGHELAGYYPQGESALRGAFERDKAVLRDIGVPLETEVLSGSDAGKTAYRIDRARYELADLRLQPDEQQALQLAVAAARLADGQFGLLKLGADGGSSPTVVANIPESPALPLLREATVAHAEVAFIYKGSPRRLQPYSLLLRDRFWYVIGHDLSHREVRTYRVDRIEGRVAAGDPGTFERPADFDLRAAFPSDPKLLGPRLPGDDGDARAKVLIDAGRAASLVRELGDDAVVERLPDGGVVVEVPCANLDAFRSWLFGFGSAAEVLHPPHVRADIVNWLTALAGAQ